MTELMEVDSNSRAVGRGVEVLLGVDDWCLIFHEGISTSYIETRIIHFVELRPVV